MVAHLPPSPSQLQLREEHVSMVYCLSSKEAKTTFSHGLPRKFTHQVISIYRCCRGKPSAQYVLLGIVTTELTMYLVSPSFPLPSPSFLLPSRSPPLPSSSPLPLPSPSLLHHSPSPLLPQTDAMGRVCWVLRRQSYDIISQLRDTSRDTLEDCRFLLCILCSHSCSYRSGTLELVTLYSH